MALPKKIVIIGGGIAGITLATQLGKKFGKKNKAHITLVDPSSSHIWKPLLHEVATGALNVGLDGVSFREHAAAYGYHYQEGRMSNLDRERKEVHLDAVLNTKNEEILAPRTIAYDHLVIALGSVSNDFGIPDVKKHAHFLDNTDQAIAIKDMLLEHLLPYSAIDSLNKQLKIAIIGAGATGVEMAAEIIHSVNRLNKLGYSITEKLINVSLIEAAPALLPKVDKTEIQESVKTNLLELGVNVMTDTRVTRLDEGKITTEEGNTISADLIIWATGIKAPNFLKDIAGLETNQINQLIVTSHLQSTIDPDIFAIGDCAACPQPDSQWVPPRGQTAQQMAFTAAQNIEELLKSQKTTHPFIFKDSGTLINLASFDTFGHLLPYLKGGMMVRGHIAYFAYKSVYRMHLLKIHGCIKGSLVLFIRFLNKRVYPKLKIY